MTELDLLERMLTSERAKTIEAVASNGAANSTGGLENK